MLETCYERLEKYMTEALKPILKFRKYRIYFYNAAVREFYSLLRAAVKSTRTVGHLRLKNDQMIPRIMGRMLHADWKEWATNRP
jgi:hypothetical protein